MHISNGTSRFVVVIGDLAFKFPKILLTRELRSLWILLRNRRWSRISVHFSHPPEALTSFQYHIVGGIISNWREFKFWQEHRHSFCEPTYCSLFGMVNVQRASPAYTTLNDEEFWHKMCRIDEYRREDGHHFSNPDNFTIRDGVLRIADYGTKETQEVILRLGTVIMGHFSTP